MEISSANFKRSKFFLFMARILKVLTFAIILVLHLVKILKYSVFNSRNIIHGNCTVHYKKYHVLP
jgi:hypothetical protein